MSNLENDLKQLIITTLNLEDVSVKDIQSEEPLFGEGLGLDSIDALELGVAIQKTYGIKIDNKRKDLKERFASVSSLAAFITELAEAPR